MDPKTKQLIESARDYEIPEVTGQAVGLACEAVANLRIAVLEQDKRARHAEEGRDLFSKRINDLDESNASLSRHLGRLSKMLAAYGLPSEPKALAGAIERERTANRDRIAELEKEVAHLRTIALGA